MGSFVKVEHALAGIEQDSFVSNGHVLPGESGVAPCEPRLLAPPGSGATVPDINLQHLALQVRNEELAAQNAELESVNEELESVNEELYTVNAQYHDTLIELAQLRRDLENLLNVMESGALFLDDTLRVVRFNEDAARALPLQHDHVGQVLPDVIAEPAHQRLVSAARAVLGSGGRQVLIAFGSDGQRWIFDVRRVRRVAATATFGVIVVMREAPAMRWDEPARKLTAVSV
jgi:PAS domain-containing protein